jgi:hypothetical protein
MEKGQTSLPGPWCLAPSLALCFATSVPLPRFAREGTSLRAGNYAGSNIGTAVPFSDFTKHTFTF